MSARIPSAREFLNHAMVVVGFCTLVALGLGSARGDWALQMVYSQAIGLSIWACTDFGRLLFKRDPATNWPPGWRRVALQTAAIFVGYVAGTGLGDVYCGCSTFALWRASPRVLASYLLLAVPISAAISVFFTARGRDQQRLRQIATAQRDASQARLKLLESQLEPHMLFNTLANLRALIALDPARAQVMLDRLIDFLRATLNASREPFHPLGAEFARIADYLELMQIRMGDRLRTRLSLPDELAALPVPPLLLQPLVENAIKHGIEPQLHGGRIEISAERSAGRLLLSVLDTGAGLASTAAGGGTHFGLAQVRTRLESVYGGAACLELNVAGAEGGTLATLSLPAP